MRESLEVEGRTCALVTPDRGLAERVAAELERWNIAIDDSAGLPLARTPPGVFLRLTAGHGRRRFCTGAAAGGLQASAGGRRQRSRRLPQPDARRRDRVSCAGRARRRALGACAIGSAAHDDASRSRMDRAAWNAACGAVRRAHDGRPRSAAARVAERAHGNGRSPSPPRLETPGPLRLWAEDAGEAAASFAAELAQSADVFRAHRARRLIPRCSTP